MLLILPMVYASAIGPAASIPSTTPDPASGFLAPENVFQFELLCEGEFQDYCDQAKDALKSAGARIASQVLFRQPVTVEVWFQDYGEQSSSFTNLAQGLPSPRPFRNNLLTNSWQKEWRATTKLSVCARKANQSERRRTGI